MKKCFFVLILFSLLINGCVVRELIIRSNPSDAKVYIDAEEKGVTPYSIEFTFYGAREIVLRKEGYESLKKVIKLPIPWYEYFPLDFISELIIPFEIKDTHEFDFTLDKISLESDSTDEIIKRANDISKEENDR
ncbi:MAG: PEGA domain-containing protein [Planctomycetota bacterium]